MHMEQQNPEGQQAGLADMPEIVSNGHDRDFSDPEFYVNRELSWISFNQRVLEEALSPELHPLLERAKFISIFSSNLDEFFMIRVAGIEKQYEAGLQKRTVDGFTPAEQLERIREMVVVQLQQRNRCLYREIIPSLEKEGIIFAVSTICRNQPETCLTSTSGKRSSRCLRRWRSIPATPSRSCPTFP